MASVNKYLGQLVLRWSINKSNRELIIALHVCNIVRDLLL